MLPLIKDNEGRVNEFEHKAVQKFFPAPGDTDAKVAAKRKGFDEFIRTKAAAPTAKAYGIDLQKYPTTSFRQDSSPPKYYVGQVIEKKDGSKIKIVDKAGNYEAVN